MSNDRHRITPYPLRLDPELRSKLEKASKSGSRSLHAEIVSRLQATFEEPEISYEQMLDNITGIIEKAVKDK